VRAHIVKRPEDYEWSGHLSYLGGGGHGLIDEGFVLDQEKQEGSPIKRHLSREKSIPKVRGVSSSPSGVPIGVGESNR